MGNVLILKKIPDSKEPGIFFRIKARIDVWLWLPVFYRYLIIMTFLLEDPVCLDRLGCMPSRFPQCVVHLVLFADKPAE